MALTPPEWRESEMQHLTELERTGKPVRYQKEYIRKDGTRVPIELLVHVVRGETGEPLHYQSFLTDLTDRKQAEDKLRRYMALLEMQDKAHKMVFENVDQSTLFDHLLRGLLQISESEFGYIGELIISDDGVPYQLSHAISNLAWTDELRNYYEKNWRDGLRFEANETLYGRVIATGKPIISNDLANDPRSKGLPEGHPPINSFMGLPIHRGDVLVGTLGVANRRDGYSGELVSFLKPYLSTCSILLSAFKSDRERKRAEDELLAAKLDWEDTFNSINDMVTIHDKNYNIIHCNTAAKRVLGLPNSVTSDVIKCYQYYHGKDCPPETCPSCQCLITHRQELFEFFEPYLNMFLEVRAIPRFDRDGQLTGLVHIVRDIIDRKKAEEALRESEERFRLAMEATNDGVWDWDLKTDQVFRSPGFFSMLGYGDEEFSGRFGEWQNLVHPEDLKAVLQALNEYPTAQQRITKLSFECFTDQVARCGFFLGEKWWLVTQMEHL